MVVYQVSTRYIRLLQCHEQLPSRNGSSSQGQFQVGSQQAGFPIRVSTLNPKDLSRNRSRGKTTLVSCKGDFLSRHGPWANAPCEMVLCSAISSADIRLLEGQ